MVKTKNKPSYDEDAIVGEDPASEIKPSKKEKYSVDAWYAYIDKEGFKVKAEFKSEADNVDGLLKGVDFPKGCNRLVNVTLNHNGNEFQRAIAPHVARKIFEEKDSFEFKRLFKGV